MTEYTLEDLRTAREELERWRDRWANSTSNNPDKHGGPIQAAARRVRMIEEALKAAGVIPMSDHEKLEAELDRQFPNARGRQIVDFQGRRYQRIFFPIERSRSGKTVTEWGKEWRLLP